MYPQEVINISWNEYGKLCECLKKKLGALPYESIVAISRGGLPIGVYLSHHLKLPLFVISAQCYNEYTEGPKVTVCPYIAGTGELGKNILLVDEINATGKTILAVREHLRIHHKVTFIMVAVFLS